MQFWVKTVKDYKSRGIFRTQQNIKMKLLAKVINASGDIFRTVFSIQNVFRTSRMALFKKIMNG